MYVPKQELEKKSETVRNRTYLDEVFCGILVFSGVEILVQRFFI